MRRSVLGRRCGEWLLFHDEVVAVSVGKLAAPIVVERALLADCLADCPSAALRRLAMPETACRAETARERQCETCNRWVTAGTDGDVEFGHVRGEAHGGPTCAERPGDDVDPRRECGRA